MNSKSVNSHLCFCWIFTALALLGTCNVMWGQIINFDGLPDYTVINTHYPFVTFSRNNTVGDVYARDAGANAPSAPNVVSVSTNPVPAPGFAGRDAVVKASFAVPVSRVSIDVRPVAPTGSGSFPNTRPFLAAFNFLGLPRGSTKYYSGPLPTSSGAVGPMETLTIAETDIAYVLFSTEDNLIAAPTLGLFDNLQFDCAYTLSLNVVGCGTVSSPAQTIDGCPCSTVTPGPAPTYGCGQVVTLTATPAPGWVFVGWSGGASGSANPLPVTMNGSTTITAMFEAQFCTDFDNGVPPGMTLFGDARVDAGYLKLYTVPEPNGYGIAYVDDFGGGRFVQSFRATFKAALFGSTAFPADGFSFNLVPATRVRANPGYAQPAEEGLDEGLSINFDTFDNGGGEAPAVEIKWLGKVIKSTPFQASQVSSTLQAVFIELKANGKLTVSYGTTALFIDEPTPYDPAAICTPQWVLGARVGTGNDNHWFDDLCISMLPSSEHQIPGLVNTGVNNQGIPLADDTVDPHYYRPSGNADVYVARDSGLNPTPAWLADNSMSAWISPATDTLALSDGLGTYDYIYRTTFDLSGFDGDSARLAGRWSTDDKGVDILINGVSTGLINSAGYGVWTPFEIQSNRKTGLTRFIAGPNSLEFKVVNGAPGSPTGMEPTGLRVEVWGAASLICPFTGSPPLPTITYQNGRVTVSWDQPGFVLQIAPAIGAPYCDLTRGISVNGSNFTHTVSASASMSFFRLRADCQ